MTATPEPTITPASGHAAGIQGPSLGVPLFNHNAALTGSGYVLLSGGFTGIANNNVIIPFPVETLQVYNPRTGVWSAIELGEGLEFVDSSVILSDDRVLVLGLGQGSSGVVNVARVFDPATEAWTSVAAPTLARSEPNVVLLNDGRVLVAGGLDLSVAFSFSSSPEVLKEVEIYDPATGGWQPAAGMTVSSEDQWLFPSVDGRVVAIAAVSGESSDPGAHAEVYDPATDAWTVIDSLEPFYRPTNAVKLSDGKLLVLGTLSDYKSMSWSGTDPEEITYVELPDGRRLFREQIADQFPDAKVYDPIADTWTSTGRMTQTRVNATLTLLPDGRVLAAGGEDPEGSEYVLYSTTEIFDPAANVWYPGPDLLEPRSSHAATLLPDGRVLLTGGIGIHPVNDERYPLQSTEFVDLTGSPRPPVTSPPAAAVACPLAPAPTPGETITPGAVGTSPYAVLDAVREVMAADSYHLETLVDWTLESEGSNVADGSRRLTMDFDGPDRVSGCGALSEPFVGDFDYRIFSMDGVNYVTNPQTGEWESREGSETLANALDFIDEEVTSQFTELALEGVETLDGVGYYRITGRMPGTALDDTALLGLLLGDFRSEQPYELQFVYWVGINDGLLKRFTAEGKLEQGSDGTLHLSIMVAISNVGEDVIIETPDLSRAQ